MADVFTLGLRLDANGAITGMKDFGNAAERTAKQTDVLDAASSRLRTTFARYTSIAGLGLIFGKIVQQTLDAQNATAQLEAAVRSTGFAAARSVTQLDNLSNAMQRVSTFSDEAVKGAEAILLTFDRIKGAEFDDAIQSVTDLATRMGGDLTGAALQLGKALQDPTEGLTALRRSGVSFSEAQQEVIKNLYEGGHAAEAQRIILAEMRKEFAGSAAAARSTLGGALKGLANDIGDVLEVTQAGTSSIVGFIKTLDHGVTSLKDYGTALKVMAAALLDVAAIVATKFVLSFGNARVAAVSAYFAMQEAQRQQTISTAQLAITQHEQAMKHIADLTAERAAVIALQATSRGTVATAAVAIVAPTSNNAAISAALKEQAAATTALNAASVRATAIDAELAIAQTGLVGSATAAATAQGVLSTATAFGARTMLFATGVAKGLWAAIGGWPGAIVAAAIVAYQVWSGWIEKHAEATQKETDAFKAQLETLHAQNQAKVAAARQAQTDAENTEKAVAKVTAERGLELQKLAELNRAHGQSADSLKLIEIRYAALGENQKFVEGHTKAQIDAFKALTKEMVAAQTVALNLASADERVAAVKEAEADALAKYIAVSTAARTATDTTGQQSTQSEELLAALKESNAAYEEKAKWYAVLNQLEQTGLRVGTEEYEQAKRDIESTMANTDAIEKLTAARKADQDAAQKRSQDAIDEWNAQIQAANDALKQAQAPWDNLMRGLQEGFAKTFQDIIEHGISSFKDFAHSLLQLFAQLASQLAALKLADKLLGSVGPDGKRRTDGLFSPGGRFDNTIGRAGAGAVSGVLSGVATGSPISGAIGGAIAGSAFGPVGTAVGAVVGAVSGLVTGLLGQAKRIREAQKEFATSLEAYIAAAGGRGGSAGDAIASALDEYKKQQKLANAAFPGDGHKAEREDALGTLQAAYAANINKITQDVFDGITQQLNALKGPAGAYANAIDAVNKQFEDTRKSLEAIYNSSDKSLEDWQKGNAEYQKALEIQRIQLERLAAAEAERALVFEQDQATRRLYAKGLTEQGDAAAFAAKQQQEMWQKIQDGSSAAEIATLRLTQAYEREAFAKQNAIAIAERTRSDALAAVEKQAQGITDQYQPQIDAQKETLDALNKQLSVQDDLLRAARQTADQTRRTADAVQSFAQSLRVNDKTASPEAQLAATKKQLDALYGKAKGGDQQAAQDFGGAANQYIDALQKYFASGTGYQSGYQDVTKMADELAKQFGDQATTEEKAANQLQTQVDLLTAQKTIAEHAIEVLQTAMDSELKALDVVRQGIETAYTSTVDAINANFDQAIRRLDLANELLAKLKPEPSVPLPPEVTGAPVPPVASTPPVAQPVTPPPYVPVPGLPPAIPPVLPPHNPPVVPYYPPVSAGPPNVPAIPPLPPTLPSSVPAYVPGSPTGTGVGASQGLPAHLDLANHIAQQSLALNTLSLTEAQKVTDGIASLTSTQRAGTTSEMDALDRVYGALDRGFGSMATVLDHPALSVPVLKITPVQPKAPVTTVTVAKLTPEEAALQVEANKTTLESLRVQARGFAQVVTVLTDVGKKIDKQSAALASTAEATQAGRLW